MGRDCRFRIVEASRGKDGEALLSEKDAGKLLDEIKAAAQKRVNQEFDIDDAITAEIAELTLNLKREQAIQKRNALINIIKKDEITNQIEGYLSEGLSIRKSFQAFLVGVNGIYTKGRSSVDAKFKAIERRYQATFNLALAREDLTRIVNNKVLQPEIEKELWQLAENKAGGVTGSKEALKVAKIIHNLNEDMRSRQNRAGAAIGKLESFTTTQTHNREKLRAAGYKKWRDYVLPLLNKETTFKGADADEFLQSVYEVLTTGVTRKRGEEGKLFEFKGPANLAKKISRPRILHFKDAESSIIYRNTYGMKDFMEGVVRNIENSSRNIALLETFGTNPRAMFDKIVDETRQKYRGDTKKMKNDNVQALNHFFDEIDGSSFIPEVPALAKIGSVTRGVQSMSKLGGALISSFSDIPVKAIELQNQGFGLFESYGISFADVGRGLGSKERKEFGAMLGVGMDGMNGAIIQRFTSQDDLPGSMSKLMRTFFKLNGLQWWTDAQKIGTAMAMSHRLATFKNLSFKSLDDDTKRLFNNYGITDKDWDIIKKSVTKFGDREYIAPDGIRGLPDELFGKNPLREKEQLEDKLRMYFVDRADIATISPDARERAILNIGTKRGTVVGELIRTMMQFKSFPVSVITKVWGNALYGKGKADIPAMLQLTTMMTAFGYGSMVGKDLAKGREPRPLDNPNTWKAAFLQGGGLGIMGDFLLGEYNRFGHDLTTTIAGPTASTLNDLGDLYAAARDGDDTAAKALNTTINNMPFANLFYIRPALNYMFIYQMQEAANPGYLRRMERRVEKQNNQKFLIKPSQIIK